MQGQQVQMEAIALLFSPNLLLVWQMRFFCSWLTEADLGPLHLLPASVPTPKIAYWRKKCQLLSSTGCFLNPLLEGTYFEWNLACHHVGGQSAILTDGQWVAVPVIQSVYQPWVTRLYSHLRTSKPVAVLYHNLCPYMRCCPATSTEYLKRFYLILSPYFSARLGTRFKFWMGEPGLPCSAMKVWAGPRE